MGSFQSVFSSLRSIPNPLKGVSLPSSNSVSKFVKPFRNLASRATSAITSKPVQKAAQIVGTAIIKNEIRSIRRAKPSFLNRIKQKITSRKNNNVGNIELSNMNQQPQPQPQPQQPQQQQPQQQQSEPKQTAGNKKKPLKKETTPSKKETTPSKKEKTPPKKEKTLSKKETNPSKKEKTRPKKETTSPKKEKKSSKK